MLRKIIFSIAYCAVCCVIALPCLEVAFRIIDGYHVFSVKLMQKGATAEIPPTTSIAYLYVQNGTSAEGVEKAWFLDLPETPKRPEPDAKTAERFAKYPEDPYGAFFVWNLNYLRKAVCSNSTLGSFGVLKDFYYFEPTEDTIYPYYRHMPHLKSRVMFMPNNFGWRGPDIAVAKPKNVVRIAFVGASTTVNGYGEAASYPEYVGHWLNKWAQETKKNVTFEVINAGRSGIDSPSIAAVVRQEVLPVTPDLVVYYEGSNQFFPLDYVQFEDKTGVATFKRPRATFAKHALENYFALAIRGRQAVNKVLSDNGLEPKKPAYQVQWPADLNEGDPAPDYPKLPLQLNGILGDLESMRTALASVQGELVVSSFVWLAYDGLRLDLPQQTSLYRYLNETFWPISYKQIRRMADFQNRVFRNYAAKNGLDFLDVATDFPQDSRLFGDAIHMAPEGIRLHAWLAFQKLVPIIERKLAAKELPKVGRPGGERHPAFLHEPRLITREELLRQCAK